MDRNTLLGFLLIAVILIGFSIMNKPDPAELEKQRKEQIASDTIISEKDSNKKTVISENTNENIDTANAAIQADTIEKDDPLAIYAPEIRKNLIGTDNYITVENDLLEVRISSKGGRISYVRLKDYETFDHKPLVLFDEKDASFGYIFPYDGQNVFSDSMFFQTDDTDVKISGDETATIKMVVEINPGQFIEHIYTFKGHDYMIGNSINLNGFDQFMPKNKNYLDIEWKSKLRQVERKQSDRIAQITRTIITGYYKHKNETPDHISYNEDETVDISSGDIKWVSFKQKFFSQVLITDNFFIKGALGVKHISDDENYSKEVFTTLTLPYEHKAVQSYGFSMYYGPNHYKTLKSYGLDMERQIFLGRNILRAINTGLIIPVFNFLGKYISNYGIIILLLTFFIKMMLFPLTYRSYLSTAKMRVLKPEIDAIKKKVGNDNTKMQQEQMKLYRKAGVSPLGGCLPMLLQMPILIAMFRFFPSSIELRQEAFLWAHDLSTYDSIWDFGEVPIISRIYGDHVSLFTLLMTISTLIYTRMNSNMMNTGGGDMAKQMKVVQYLMPILFLGFFNNYSAGLSYYYFLANIITFGQQYLFKLFINEDKLRAKIEANKKKNAAKPKSKFQKRLEDMQKQQREVQKKRR